MASAKLDEVLSAQKPSFDKADLGYVDSSGPSFSIPLGSKTVIVVQSEKGDKCMKSKTNLTNSISFVKPHFRKSSSTKLLMFVTIVVFLDTFVLIALSCTLKIKCPNSHKFPLMELHICLESY